MQVMGKYIIFAGLILVFAGLVMVLASRVPWLGRLPGDIVIRREGFTVYFPLATCILISIILSIIFYLTGRK
ncbi:MAG: DUF2905 family protein [Candidatus Omnitrophica bacterium]|nr:DUF2905 family protein [Candidatus Omnitrophota bacterium]